MFMGTPCICFRNETSSLGSFGLSSDIQPRSQPTTDESANSQTNAGEVPNGLQYTSCGGYVLYPLGSIIVLRNIATGKQAFLEGHSGDVSCIASSKDNVYLASGQDSFGTTKADVMVWDLKQTMKNCDDGNPSAGGCLIHRLNQHIGKVQVRLGDN